MPLGDAVRGELQQAGRHRLRAVRQHVLHREGFAAAAAAARGGVVGSTRGGGGPSARAVYIRTTRFRST